MTGLGLIELKTRHLTLPRDGAFVCVMMRQKKYMLRQQGKISVLLKALIVHIPPAHVYG